jgi:hypothetical protein
LLCVRLYVSPQARDSNAEIMASFYRRGSSEERGLRPVPEEAGGAGSSKTGSGAGRVGGNAAASGGEGQGTPTNGSELGVSRFACVCCTSEGGVA